MKIDAGLMVPLDSVAQTAAQSSYRGNAQSFPCPTSVTSAAPAGAVASARKSK